MLRFSARKAAHPQRRSVSGDHTSVWPRSVREMPSFPSLGRDAELKVDVAVIGGGITGMTAALNLRRAGLKVAVVEAGEIGCGVSKCTTGHLSTGIEAHYSYLAHSFGIETARIVANAAKTAVTHIEDNINEGRFDAEFRRLPGYLYTEDEDELGFLRHEAEEAESAGLITEFTTEVPLPYKTKAAVKYEDQGEFNSLKYLSGLAGLITTSKGAYADKPQGQIFTNSSVKDIESLSTLADSKYRIHTETGGKVTAEAVVEGTNIPLGIGVVDTVVAPFRSYVIAVQLEDDRDYPQGLFWDTSEPYHYIRTCRDPRGGKNAKLMLVGGEDHKTGNKVNTNECVEKLEAWTRKRFKVKEVVYNWSAQVYEPVDHLPFIGPMPMSALTPSSHETQNKPVETIAGKYIATGFAGDGLIWGTMSGIILPDLITGRSNDFARVFSPARLIRQPTFESIKTMVAHNLEVGWQFFKDRIVGKDSEVKQIDALSANSGSVMKIQGQQLAVYRDEGGVLHYMSPVCPHARCIVEWNDGEKNWDCPCHGSRFSAYGKRLGGPAMSDLTRYEVTHKGGGVKPQLKTSHTEERVLPHNVS